MISRADAEKARSTTKPTPIFGALVDVEFCCSA
jgi:hypothetical protein